MSKTREQRIKEVERLSALSDEVEKELQHFAGVSYVSVGLRVVKNLPTEEICFRVYVTRKKTLSELSETERIPSQIRGVKTDVNEIPTNISASVLEVKTFDDSKYRPLVGGSKIRSAKGIDYGTLGCFINDDENDRIALLTNYHVLFINGEEKGHQVAQPDFCCEYCCCRCGEIATLERGAWDDDNVDCAIATLTGDNQQQWTNEILELGRVSPPSLDEHGKPKDPPVVGDTVFKRGMNSGLTEGLIIEVMKPDKTISVGYPTKHGVITKEFTGQLVIGPKDFNKPFTRKGDSGAVIVNHLNQVIGLHFADDEQRDENDNVLSDATRSIANPIADVLRVLNISIPDTGTDLSLELIQSGTPAAPKKIDTLYKLEEIIEQHPDGPALIDAFKEHRREVMDLVNNNREVKVAWHRSHGPAFVAHLMEKIKDAAHVIPASIDTVSYQRMLTKMSVVLEKNGSPALRLAIEKNSTRAFLLLAGLMNSLNDNRLTL